jgi:NTE family protein/lysophospholipid hydrolase
VWNRPSLALRVCFETASSKNEAEGLNAAGSDSQMESSLGTRSPEELVQLLAETALFRDVDRTALDGIKSQLEWVTLEDGEDLFRDGDVVDALYVVADGWLEVTKAKENRDGDPTNDRLVLARLAPPATIGEMQILMGGLRSATVTASLPSGLVKFPKPAFDQLLAQDQRIVEELTKTIMPRLFRDQMVGVLPRLFGELDKAMLRDLEKKMTWLCLRRGQVLCRQGDPSNSFFVVINGRLQVIIQDVQGISRQVAEVSQGESIGEMGVCTGQPRSATIIASRDSELVQFSKEAYDEFTTRYPQLMRHLMKLLIGRLQRVNFDGKSSSLSANILVAPASNGAPVAEFAHRLFAALCDIHSERTHGVEPCLLLTSREVDGLMNVPGISQASGNEPNDLRLRSWLSQKEQRYKVILFQADPTLTNWTKRCIRSTDEIIYVAEPGYPSPGTEVSREIHDQETQHHTRRRRALMLIHPDDTVRPSNTRRWLKALHLETVEGDRHSGLRHFHLRRSSEGDFHRIARYVSGREVGLALSGGGARGFAHVGCIKAMHELKIPIDMIGGVSMGSLVSAAYAFDPERFEETIRTVKSQLKGVLFDLTPPVVSIARGRRFDQRLQGWFGDVCIEDLWVPYFCVASNLTKANIEVFDTDALWWAVRASGTLPGLTAPQIRDGCLLFDGCLLDNLPMDVMRERMGSSKVIAVDVVPPQDLKVDVTEVQSPSGWWLLWKKLTRLGPKVELPSIVSIMQRAAELGSVYGRHKLIESRLADIYLQPPVEDIFVADFKKVDEAARIGYEHGKGRLAEWWSNVESNAS